MKRNQNRKESVVVLLRGEKGTAPLCWALRSVVRPKDALLVITIVNAGSPSAAAAAAAARQPSCFPFGFSHSCDGNSFSDEGEGYMKFLQQLISERRAGYLQTLKPFYNKCKSTGVKFQAKVAAGFRPRTIALEEANNVEATWIVMDRGLVEDSKFSSDSFNVALVNDNEEAEVHKTVRLLETSTEPNEPSDPGSPQCVEQNSSLVEPHTGDSLTLPNCLRQANEDENPMRVDVDLDGDIKEELQIKIQIKPETVLGQPVEMGLAEILEMTDGICEGNYIGKEANAILYKGVMKNEGGFPVLVKRFTGECEGEIEGELRAASTLSHRNILVLMGYYHANPSYDLVYACGIEGTLDQYLSRAKGKAVGLSWPERMKIATETGRGLRYLHEECPRGPVVHHDLRPGNIYLTDDFRPVITGFKQARWLWMDQSVYETSKLNLNKARCGRVDLSDEDLIALKSDVFSFGVLLLRLFCPVSILPEDDQRLVDWARPLLLKCALHELLDRSLDELDMYEIYRVMSAAALCTRIKPQSRPGMTQVVSILRGENSCVLQFSPAASEGSLDRQTGSLS